MACANIELPAGAVSIPATLFFLDKGGISDIGYLQRVRSMKTAKGAEDLLKDMEQRYARMVPTWSQQLATHVKESVDAVVSPTSFPHPPEPYREAIKKKFAKAVDLTERFTRSCDYSSGEEAAFDRMMEAVSYTPAGDEPQCRTLVIVDDIVSSGRTAALVVSKVRDAGLPVGARILVAAPLWLPRKSV